MKQSQYHSTSVSSADRKTGKASCGQVSLDAGEYFCWAG